MTSTFHHIRRGPLLATLAIGLGLTVALLAGCRATIATNASYNWRFYPGADVYYSPTYGSWAYYSDGTWVRVEQRPTWVTIDSSSYVQVEYRDPDPWVRWEFHVERHGPPGHANPRSWRGSHSHAQPAHPSNNGNNGRGVGNGNGNGPGNSNGNGRGNGNGNNGRGN